MTVIYKLLRWGGTFQIVTWPLLTETLFFQFYGWISIITEYVSFIVNEVRGSTMKVTFFLATKIK